MLSVRQALGLLPAALLAASACDAVSDPIPLDVSVVARPNTLATGDTTRIDVTIRNFNLRPVTFDSNCTISFQIRPVGDTTDVANRGNQICLAYVRETTLGPFESYTEGFRWHATRRSCAGTTCVIVPVPAGDYRVTGSLHNMVSPPVPLRVR